MKHSTLLFALLIALSILLSACADGAAPAEGDDVALKVTGSVANEQAWTEDEVKAMNAIDVESTNSQGTSDTYTGVLITDFLAAAQPNADASNVVFVGDDGSTAEVSLEELSACTDCILSFRTKGGFSSILPGFSKKTKIKGVIEIQVK
jgi:ABC-type glycerol-3-phosphate transport system substrate-binding protein